MITTQTPFRLSFFGGGSDLASFYTRYPGAVLSVGINKSMFITSHPYFDPGYLNLKYYSEFAAENRPHGWNTWVTFTISPPAPTPTAPPRRMVTK